jgi:peptidoglycan/LPS O-acetylase OafA/YrhL
MILSGRVLTASVLHSKNLQKLAHSLFFRAIRLVVPLLVIGYLNYLLSFVFANCERYGHDISNPLLPFFIIIHFVLGYGVWASPLPAQAWCMNSAFRGSILVYVLTFIVIALDIQPFSRRLTLFLVLSIIAMLFNSWCSYYIVGLIYADMGKQNLFKKLREAKYGVSFVCGFLFVAFILAFRSPVTFGKPVAAFFYKWVMNDNESKFGVETKTHLTPKPTMVFYAASVFLAIEVFDLPKKILQNKVFLFLGERSFAIFLCHETFIDLIGIPLIDLIGNDSIEKCFLIIIIGTVLMLMMADILEDILMKPGELLIAYLDKNFVHKETTSSELPLLSSS